MKEKVLLGMSGGVDSSTTAVLLQQHGYEVIGCTMLLWECDKNTVEDAKKVCDKLGIIHYILDCRNEFQKQVVDDFICKYKEAKTPNPCVECNKYLKFGVLYKKAKELGCNYLATGHYAKVEYSEKYKQKVIKKASEENKDQSYFLYAIPKEVISSIMFPLQEYTNKEQIRKIAEQNNLFVAQKKDSQEICFIPQNNYTEFLEKNEDLQTKQGNIVLKTGEILGKHKGLIYYTAGQRKGLGISYKEPLYVIKLDKKTNQVIVGPEKELYSIELYANNLNWLVLDTYISDKFECLAKIRYRAKETKACVERIEKDMVKVTFEAPQRAITPGQSVVFYDKDGVMLGGGKIHPKSSLE